MLTPPDDGKDGSRLSYLKQPARWRHLDPGLFDVLAAITAEKGANRIARIEKSGILPGAIFYSDLIPDSAHARADFMSATWQRFKSVDLVFFDPDNGIEVSKPKGRKGSSKYIYWNEIEATYRRGHSVLVYQHFDRQSREDQIAKRCRELRRRLPASDIWLFRTSHVLFLLAVHERHSVKLNNVLEWAAARLSADIGVQRWREGERTPVQLPTVSRSKGAGNANDHSWVGPFKIGDLLAHTVDGSIPLPPNSRSVYLISRHGWVSRPSKSSSLLYVGGNTGESERFRTRIGDLMANLFGFFSEETRRHSGGKRLHEWCKEHQINPLTLYIAWVDGCACHRCLEVDLFQELQPLLNRATPPACLAHGNRGAIGQS